MFNKTIKISLKKTDAADTAPAEIKRISLKKTDEALEAAERSGADVSKKAEAFVKSESGADSAEKADSKKKAFNSEEFKRDINQSAYAGQTGTEQDWDEFFVSVDEAHYKSIIEDSTLKYNFEKKVGETKIYTMHTENFFQKCVSEFFSLFSKSKELGQSNFAEQRTLFKAAAVLGIVLLGIAVFCFVPFGSIFGKELSSDLFKSLPAAVSQKNTVLFMFDADSDGALWKARNKILKKILSNNALMKMVFSADSDLDKRQDFSGAAELTDYFKNRGAVIADVKFLNLSGRYAWNSIIFMNAVSSERSVESGFKNFLSTVGAFCECKEVNEGRFKIYETYMLSQGVRGFSFSWMVYDGCFWLGLGPRDLQEFFADAYSDSPKIADSESYKKAAAELPYYDNGLLYVNFKSIFDSIPPSSAISNRFIKSADYAVMGFDLKKDGSDKRYVNYCGRAAFDKHFTALFKDEFFSDRNSIEFKTLKYQPFENKSCTGFNIKVLYNMLRDSSGDIISLSSDNKNNKDKLTAVWEKASEAMRPFLNCTTGEMTISIRNADFSAASQLDKAELSRRLRKEPWTVCIGLKNRKDFESFLMNSVFYKILKLSGSRTIGNNVNIYSLFRNFIQIGIADDALIICSNITEVEMNSLFSESFISWENEKSFSGSACRPIISKGIVVSWEDSSAVNGTAAEGQDKNTLGELMNEGMDGFKNMAGYKASSISADKEGLIINGAFEIKL